MPTSLSENGLNRHDAAEFGAPASWRFTGSGIDKIDPRTRTEYIPLRCLTDSGACPIRC